MSEIEFRPAGGGGSGTGERGPEGEKGLSVLHGEGAPAPALGRNEEFYIDTLNTELYGPKTAGSWGVGVKLKGATGPEGPKGTTGEKGEKGEKGEAGAGLTPLAFAAVESLNAKLENEGGAAKLYAALAVATGADGVTHMTGAGNTSAEIAAGGVLFILPVAHRPTKKKRIAAAVIASSVEKTLLNIETNGEVKLQASLGISSLISLDDITFSHEH